MRRIEKGFTLIELVIVLVILGILAAVAIPRFEDLSGDAKTAAKGGGLSAVGSGIAIATANQKGAITAASIANFLPGSVCTVISSVAYQRIGSSGSNVFVDLKDGTTAITSCSSTVNAVGSATWSTTTTAIGI